MSQVTEQELQERTSAPRVSLDDLKKNIQKVEYIYHGLLTICVITLQNGFTVTGESACVSPENYLKDVGERISYQNAEEKIWGFMGYALRQKHHEEKSGTFSTRLEDERDELNGRLTKLRAFLRTDASKNLDPEPLALLVQQEELMTELLTVLITRRNLLD